MPHIPDSSPVRLRSACLPGPADVPALVLALALVLTACGPGGDARTRDPSALGASDADALPSLVAVEELRIGSLEDPEVGFTQIGSVDVDEEGRIYVFESRDLHIRVYGPDGELIRTIGRRGDGPGEFARTGRLGVLGDTLWVVESLTSARITLFSRDGRVLATGRADGIPIAIHGGGSGIVLPVSLGVDGLFVGDITVTTSAARAPDAGSVQPGDTVRVPRIRFDVTGAVVDTAGWTLRLPPPSAARIDVGSNALIVPQPPGPTLRIRMEDGEVLVERPPAPEGVEGVFTVTRLGFGGDTTYSRSFLYAPRRYPPQFLDSLAAIYAPGRVFTSAGGQVMAPQPGDTLAARRAIRAAMAFPNFQPPVQQGWAGRDGSVLLRREEPTAPDEPVYRWIVLSPDGSPRGELAWSRPLRILWSSDHVFWASEADELGVQWLMRFAIRESGG